MHIIGLIVTVLAGVGFWYWRMKAATDVVRGVGDAAGRLKGVYNRRRFRLKVEGSTLTGIEDPKLGAAVLLVSIVEAGRRIAPEDETAISRWLRDVADEEKPEDAITFARWATREVPDVNEVVRRLTPLFKRELGPRERDELIEFAATLSQRTGAAEPAQTEGLRRLRNVLIPNAVRERSL